MIRSTTSGTLNTYRYNLQRSTLTMNKTYETMLTQRQFNSFAEDPATAVRSFQLRRSYLRAESQYEVGDSVVKKYDVAWSTLDSVLSSVNQEINGSSYSAIVKAESDTSASGRNALGQSLSQMAESIVLTMNSRYGEDYVFSGADGLTIPFTWEEIDGKRTLCYRGVSVDAADGSAALDTLNYLSKEESAYVDLGLGLEEDENGNIVSSSAFNAALQGINYLGYGVDEDGDPKNIVSIMSRMGEILQNCNADDGSFAGDEKAEFYRLAEKFEAAASLMSDKHVEMDAQASFLQGNQEQLESISNTLNEQIGGLEDVDLAEAITSFSWARYCYDAALQAGSSVLSKSLMDYLN